MRIYGRYALFPSFTKKHNVEAETFYPLPRARARARKKECANLSSRLMGMDFSCPRAASIKSLLSSSSSSAFYSLRRVSPVHTATALCLPKSVKTLYRLPCDSDSWKIFAFKLVCVCAKFWRDGGGACFRVTGIVNSTPPPSDRAIFRF